ncbi:MAG: hypothetical protein IT303_16675 [Dehalococcoidia bacterium]|nr:hypothetical protein [Dehalococcoidia bacterium]
MTSATSRLTLGAALAGAAMVGGVLFAVAMFTSAGTASGVPAMPAGQAPGIDSQVAVLADGVVTDQEYADAVNATVACIQGLGIATEPPQQQANGSWVYPYGGARTIAELNQMESRVNAACKGPLLARIEQTWLDSR